MNHKQGCSLAAEFLNEEFHGAKLVVTAQPRILAGLSATKVLIAVLFIPSLGYSRIRMSNLIQKNFEEAQHVLARFSTPENYAKIDQAATLMADAVKAGRKIISCGNGGSMCDAMHFAEELTGKFRSDRPAVPAISISDPSHMSCVGNDYGYEFVFSRYLEALGQHGDVLLAISTSGTSKNVLQAAAVAQKKGMVIIALTGNEGGKLAQVCDLELRVPHSGYADRIQEVHIKIIHSLIQSIEFKLFGEQC
jgi:D-sedoheptulose 7-phosphate isomerase